MAEEKQLAATGAGDKAASTLAMDALKLSRQLARSSSWNGQFSSASCIQQSSIT